MKLLFVLITFVAYIQAASYDRKLLQSESLDDEIRQGIDGTWGGDCITDSQCTDTISYCDKGDGIAITGKCALNWWVWVIIGGVALILLGAVVACICCPCCLCFACCSAIMECLCCCCNSKGYSPANRG